MPFDSKKLKKWIDQYIYYYGNVQTVEGSFPAIAGLSMLRVVREKVEELEQPTFGELKVGEFFRWVGIHDEKPRQKIAHDTVVIVGGFTPLPALRPSSLVKRLKPKFEEE